LRADLLLLITSAIWGFAFVAQRAGMHYLGPFLFNGIRFMLGSLWLLPVLFLRRNSFGKPQLREFTQTVFPSGAVLGLILFAAASLQQFGIVGTTAGKAGFITGLYVIIVPFLGLFLKRFSPVLTWLGAILAVLGLYFLSIKESIIPETGDLLVLCGAFFWAFHVLAIDRFVKRSDAFLLAFIQFLVCALLSLIFGFFSESLNLQNVVNASISLLYAGVFSVGIGYTLQVVAQKEANPAHAAIILSLEAVFAALGGWLILSEVLSPRELLGCLLMLSGMIFSQLFRLQRRKTEIIVKT
jgi:drug/metabolite transporter (DMT)-like permease